MRTTVSAHKIISILILLILLVSVPNLKFGQQSVIKGIVCDREGKPLDKAKITFIDRDRGTKFSIKSKKDGKFMKVGIPPSLYRITVELKGYFPFQTRYRIRFGVNEGVKIILDKIPPKIEEDKNFAQGISHFKQSQYREAIDFFKKVTQKFPENFEGFYNLGLSYLKSGNIDEAIIALERTIILKPDLAEVHFALGECYFNKGNKEKAIEAFSKVIEFQPDNAKAYYNLGITYYKYDEADKALISFEKSIALDPEYSSAYYQAGLANIRIGDFKKAAIYLEQFLRLKPDAPEAEQVKIIIQELKKKTSL